MHEAFPVAFRHTSSSVVDFMVRPQCSDRSDLVSPSVSSTDSVPDTVWLRGDATSDLQSATCVLPSTSCVLDVHAGKRDNTNGGHSIAGPSSSDDQRVHAVLAFWHKNFGPYHTNFCTPSSFRICRPSGRQGTRTGIPSPPSAVSLSVVLMLTHWETLFGPVCLIKLLPSTSIP